MRLVNTTKISDELIKAIAEDVGLDLRAAGVLELEYSTAINAKRDGVNGGFYHYRDTLAVMVRPDAGTSTLAHELRHAAQCQKLGAEVFETIYKEEEKAVGYWENILEEDAREAGERWKA